MEVPRCLVPSLSQYLIHDLHYFCDGSIVGYGSVVYLRSYYSATHEVVISFIISKARVMPVKKITEDGTISCFVVYQDSRQPRQADDSQHIERDILVGQ